MKRFQSILCASVLAISLSPTVLAGEGDIHTKVSGDIHTVKVGGDIHTSNLISDIFTWDDITNVIVSILGNI